MINSLTPTQLADYKLAIDEIVASMLIIKAQQEHIKEICLNWKDESDIAPKTTKAVAKIVYEANLDEQRIEKEELFTLVEAITE